MKSLAKQLAEKGLVTMDQAQAVEAAKNRKARDEAAVSMGRHRSPLYKLRRCRNLATFKKEAKKVLLKDPGLAQDVVSESKKFADEEGAGKFLWVFRQIRNNVDEVAQDGEGALEVYLQRAIFKNEPELR